MSARKRTDTVVVPAAAVTVAAMVANAPVVAAIAATVAAFWVARNGRDLSFAAGTPAFPNSDPTRPTPAFRPETAAFHGFEGDDALLHDVDPDDEEEDDDPRSDTEQVVDHLTAELESDDNISFLPPYASGKAPAVERSDDDPLTVLWEPPPDSSLLAVLDDVLETSSKMPVPRRFALGTVAILRNLLQPADVERILAEQKRYPRLRFGDIAVQLGFLSEAELEELLEAQVEGVFTDEEIIDTRARLQAYHLELDRRETA
ncbi:MAG: hypothetical protein OEU54_04420 [Gemmatimonadota bacterium]|nr:hypothetical protein [Gemmatimonadota bacterium]